MTWAKQSDIGKSLMRERARVMADTSLIVQTDGWRTEAREVYDLGEHGGPPRTYANRAALRRMRTRKALKQMRASTARGRRSIHRAAKSVTRMAAAARSAIDSIPTNRISPLAFDTDFPRTEQR